jgi:hypothetical protein
MIYQELFNLFGHSEFNPEVKEMFNRLHIPPERPEKSVCWRDYRSEKLDLSLQFTGKNNYKHDYGPVLQEYIADHDESVLEEINFGSHKGRTNYPFPLPNDLSFADSPDVVRHKMNIKPSESSDASYGSYLLFNTDSYQFVTGFDKNEKLIWIRVRPLEINFRKKRELTKTLRLQNKNLTNLNLNILTQLKTESPTRSWTKRMNEGDSIFNDDNIGAMDKLLNSFIDALIVAVKKKDAKAIYSATKKAILSINKLNAKHQEFIETLEREELAEHIHKAVRLTGFKIENEIDLTEEWREW